MPRNFMFTKEQVINAAIELTRERGFAAVTARSGRKARFVVKAGVQPF